MSDRVALLFTKPSIPGRVKTRLIGELNAEQAAGLHAALLEDVLSRIGDGEFDLRIAWAVELAEPLPATPWAGFPQQGESLGERLYRGLVEAADDALAVAAVGSDHPALEASDLEEAFTWLEADDADIVLGPAEDGGYYLLAAMRSVLRRELFDGIPWSTGAVLDETLSRCERLGLRVHLLRREADVDRPEDLRRLVADLAAGRVESPVTVGLLREWGYLPAQPVEKETG